MKRLCLMLSLFALFVGACAPQAEPAAPTPAPPAATATSLPLTVPSTLTPEPTAAATPPPTNTAQPKPTKSAALGLTPVPTSSLFLASSQVFKSTATFQIGLGDLDGDGDMDAVSANMDAYSQVWLNDGAGGFTDTEQRLTQQGHGVGVGDLDGDGDLDLFITCAGLDGSNKPSQVYLNDGKANFSPGQSLGDLRLSGNSIDLIDIDGDGDLDASVQYYESPYRLYLNDGKGTFEKSDVTFPEGWELAWGDLDADGDVDVFAKELGKGYKTLLNDGAGKFKDHWQMPDSTVEYGYKSAALGDVDGDGDLDAFVTNGSQEAGASTLVLLNDGSGGFEANGQTLPAVIKAWVELGDVDGDKDLDAFMAIVKQPQQLWLNDGKGHFSDSGLRLGRDLGTRGCVLGDLDSDGDLDVFVSKFFSGSNAIWFNQTR